MIKVGLKVSFLGESPLLKLFFFQCHQLTGSHLLPQPLEVGFWGSRQPGLSPQLSPALLPQKPLPQASPAFWKETHAQQTRPEAAPTWAEGVCSRGSGGHVPNPISSCLCKALHHRSQETQLCLPQAGGSLAVSAASHPRPPVLATGRCVEPAWTIPSAPPCE